MGALDTPLKRGRRSAIHSGKRGVGGEGGGAAFVLEKSLKRELTRLLLEFRLASGILAEPRPRELRFHMINSRTRGEPGTRAHKETGIRYEQGCRGEGREGGGWGRSPIQAFALKPDASKSPSTSCA